ncbi:MAG: ATP-binding cassette domain-containing protein, partial [Acetatifactor sp.]|nr:ATP-binding cassette domain-containing protein [Acetatifactor sp.]
MIELKEIRKTYGKGESATEVLKGISVSIREHSYTVILGASGSGKSTLLNVASGLERPDGGAVLYDQRDITGLSEDELTAFRKENIGFIFQQYY